jgi:hypothetical protein
MKLAPQPNEAVEVDFPSPARPVGRGWRPLVAPRQNKAVPAIVAIAIRSAPYPNSTLASQRFNPTTKQTRGTAFSTPRMGITVSFTNLQSAKRTRDQRLSAFICGYGGKGAARGPGAAGLNGGLVNHLNFHTIHALRTSLKGDASCDFYVVLR